MPYITREDGEHFVIPSYRDVLIAKQKNQLKKDILLLSQSYGEYITLQKKSPVQYEVAFSPDTGYLLGESIWHNFKRPIDMIYCEAIPNTTEAILVIVKAGSVYLDGSFPLDSIPEELIIFLTQQNNFDIYTYGDVPISEIPETGKFSFEASSVKSFTVLDKPAFPTLPLLKIYQLQLVNTVLKAQGIGVFPLKQAVSWVVLAGLVWLIWSYMTTQRTEIKQVETENPYQVYSTTLNSPAPEEEVVQFVNVLTLFNTMPGWTLQNLDYANGSVNALVLSGGGTIDGLNRWALNNHIAVNIKKDGIYLSTTITVPKRPNPKNIYEVKRIVTVFIDRLATVYPGNHLSMGDFVKNGVITQVSFTITLDDITPLVLQLIGKQFQGLPLVLRTISITAKKGSSFNGSIIIDALGN